MLCYIRDSLSMWSAAQRSCSQLRVKSRLCCSAWIPWAVSWESRDKLLLTESWADPVLDQSLCGSNVPAPVLQHSQNTPETNDISREIRFSLKDIKHGLILAQYRQHKESIRIPSISEELQIQSSIYKYWPQEVSTKTSVTMSLKCSYAATATQLRWGSPKENVLVLINIFLSVIGMELREMTLTWTKRMSLQQRIMEMFSTILARVTPSEDTW